MTTFRDAVNQALLDEMNADPTVLLLGEDVVPVLRREFAGDTLAQMTADVPDAREALRAVYGLDLSIGDWAVPAWFVVVVLVALAAVCTVLSAVRTRLRIR